MSNKLVVLGTYDQPVTALFDVDLMRCLAESGVPPAAIVFKRSHADENPAMPVDAVDAAGRLTIHVNDFNAPAVVARVSALSADLMVYAGGRDLLRQPLLDSARLGCLGGHYGHLPAIRGMATVEWSVLLGEPPTVAIQLINPGIDTGDVVMQASVPLMPNDNFVDIRQRSYFLTKSMLALSARRLLVDGVMGTPQARDAGRQYYRMHPALQRRAERALAQTLGGFTFS